MVWKAWMSSSEKISRRLTRGMAEPFRMVPPHGKTLNDRCQGAWHRRLYEFFAGDLENQHTFRVAA
jgi:hypothetical protein